MPARVALVVPRVEAVRTAATGLRDEVDDRIAQGAPAHDGGQDGPADHRLCGDS